MNQGFKTSQKNMIRSPGTCIDLSEPLSLCAVVAKKYTNFDKIKRYTNHENRSLQWGIIR